MEQMIDQNLVKKMRSEKCWSQEHLALVSGLSLRTVQRVENEGKCSLDSMKALAAALELEISEISAKSESAPLPLNDTNLEVALSWLKSIDSGKYKVSWQEASSLFQSRVSNEEWVKLLSQVRTPLGGVKSRSITSASESRSLPGVPDGQYIVVTFESSFDQKQSALETVTLSGKDNEFRVAGYFIK